ncbi:enoyl-CoA hydratase/isomerase family protein [Rivibacter subsaxonicus]|uniref:Isohexenylglutaconyl-CoA hydratase n=1 Tax=Rivibacter subsaxonicus TaxID=457575 RepID=A0A4Q7VWH4_9BURK|nr:enoyl-CoA hydratase-related protein [Rivibacter subsaxonicus]RZU00963.1 isohexenylglutaconyl-CoA hydratase [Rivibacter subsaxonicus]
MSPFETIAVAGDAGVLHLTLNRPAQRNAMSLQMVQELRASLAAAEADAAVRVIVLRGAGGHFCAGGDIGDMAAARGRVGETGADPMADVSRAFGELCVAFASTPKALVAVLEGTVMGGGFGLACVADVAIADESASFRLPETSLGVVPAQIAPFLVERLGYSEAKRLAVSGGRLDAREALALRLVHEVHPSGEALDVALERVLHGILQCAPGAIAATKALIAKARLQSPGSLVDEAAQVFSRAVLGPEGTEGTLAFMQKRKASWMPGS